MSIQEATQKATSPSLLKPEVKPKPDIPPKPAPQSDSAPVGDAGSIMSLSEGKVKRIVNKFSKKETELGHQPANGTAGGTPDKRFRRPPTIKPKPGRASLQLQIGGEQAPPLPMKRSRKLKETEPGEEGSSISVEGGRSGTAGFHSGLH